MVGLDSGSSDLGSLSILFEPDSEADGIQINPAETHACFSMRMLIQEAARHLVVVLSL